MRIAELGEGEARGGFTVHLLEKIGDRASFGAVSQERRELVDYADPERHPGDSQERASIHLVFHVQVLRFSLQATCSSLAQTPAAALQGSAGGDFAVSSGAIGR